MIANAALWTVFVGLLAVGSWYEYRLRSPFLLVWPMIFVFVGLPLGLEIVGLTTPHNPTTIFYALSIGIVFCACYFFGFLAMAQGYGGLIGSDISHPVFHHRGQFAFVCFTAIGLVLTLLYVNGVTLQAIWFSNWRDKTELGFDSVLISWLVAGLAGCLFYALEKKYLVIALSIIGVSLTVLIFYRTRGIVASYFVAGCIYWIIYKRGSLLRVIAIGAIAALSAVLVRSIRFMGSISDATYLSEVLFLFRHHLREIFVSGDLSVYRYYLQIIEQCGQTLNCFNFTYLTSITDRIGSNHSPSERIEYSLFDQLVQEGIGGSLHPTIFGTVFADFGFFLGMFFMLFLGALHGLLKAHITGQRALFLIGFLGSYTVFFARGSIFNGLVALFAGIVISFVLTYLLRFRVSKFQRA